MAEKDQGQVVNCEGCSGGGFWRPPLGRERTCRSCGGLGKIRLLQNEVWCGRCGATGETESGIPGAVSYKSCSICGGRGRKVI